MEFKNINSRAAAFEYADKIGGVPRVPFSIFWEFYPEDEIKISEVARQVQEVFNMVQSTEPFKIEMVEKIEDDIFNIMIEPGGLIPFKVGQNIFGQRRTARKIDEQLDAYRKKKKEQKAPEKRRKSSNELHEEFKKREEKIREEKIREEKILAEIRAESLAKAEAEAAKTLAKAKAEVEALTKVKAEVEALVNTLAEAKAEAKAAKEAKVETEAKAEAEVETKAKAKATTLKLFGYTVFEYSK